MDYTTLPANSDDMSTTRVRSHPRRGSRGVRAHLRIVPAERPIYIRTNEWGPRETVASVPPFGDVIELNHPPVEGTATRGLPDAYVRILGHETLHHAINRVQEPRASFMLDELVRERSSPVKRRLLKQGASPNDYPPIPMILTKSGLHPAWRGKR